MGVESVFVHHSVLEFVTDTKVDNTEFHDANIQFSMINLAVAWFWIFLISFSQIFVLGLTKEFAQTRDRTGDL